MVGSVSSLHETLPPPPQLPPPPGLLLTPTLPGLVAQHLCNIDSEPQEGAYSWPRLDPVPTLATRGRRESTRLLWAFRGSGTAFCQIHVVSDLPKWEKGLGSGSQQDTTSGSQVQPIPRAQAPRAAFLHCIQRQLFTSNINCHSATRMCTTKKDASSPRKTPRVSCGSAPNTSQGLFGQNILQQGKGL